MLQQDSGRRNRRQSSQFSPRTAWLKVIEADGEQNMVAGTNDGEQSDVFGDETFGSQDYDQKSRRCPSRLEG